MSVSDPVAGVQVVWKRSTVHVAVNESINPQVNTTPPSCGCYIVPMAFGLSLDN